MPKLARQFLGIARRQQRVHHHHIRVLRPRQFHRRLRVRRLAHNRTITLLLQHAARALPKQRVVIYKHHTNGIHRPFRGAFRRAFGGRRLDLSPDRAGWWLLRHVVIPLPGLHRLSLREQLVTYTKKIRLQGKPSMKEAKGKPRIVLFTSSAACPLPGWTLLRAVIHHHIAYLPADCQRFIKRALPHIAPKNQPRRAGIHCQLRLGDQIFIAFHLAAAEDDQRPPA